MSQASPVVITGVGAVSPVGLSAPSTCAALRAGIARLREMETHAVDGELFDKQPVIGGRVPTEWFAAGPVQEEWPGHERFKVPPPPPPEALVESGHARLVELAVPAVREAWQSTGLAAHSPRNFGLYLGTSEDDDPNPVADAVVRALGAKPDVVAAERQGRSAALVAADRAFRDLQAGRVSCALVGGVDSLLRRERLERLDAAGALKSASSPQGVIPGEAAAFIVLEPASLAQSRGASALARLCSTVVVEEPTAGTDAPNQAVGLTRALRAARAALGASVSSMLMVCDLNGDRYRGLEWSLARLRALAGIPGNLTLWHPADCIGDVGAASGALNAAWSVTALRKAYAGADHVLVWGASDGKARAAAALIPEPSSRR